MDFDEAYYERGLAEGLSLYTDYRWLPELTIPMCAHLVMDLKISETDIILDFGCAKGFVVKGFRLLSRNAYGADISGYAITQAPRDIQPYVTKMEVDQDVPLFLHRQYDWILAKDVLEHVPYDEVGETLGRLRRATTNLFVIVPLGADGKFTIPANDLDVTHKIREPANWWTQVFGQADFRVEFFSYRWRGLKAQWAKYDKGIGFYVLA